MKTFFKDIFEYHHHFNKKLIHQLMEYESQLPQRLIALMSHTINAHQVWNARIVKKKTLDLHQQHSLQNCMLLDRYNYRETLKIIDTHTLSEKITYSNSKGFQFINSIEQILFHVSNHFSHHKGQIVADLRQHGISPIVTDYIFYKRQSY